MAFIRTLIIIVIMLIGWTALRHPGLAGSSASIPAPPAAASQG